LFDEAALCVIPEAKRCPLPSPPSKRATRPSLESVEGALLIHKPSLSALRTLAGLVFLAAAAAGGVQRARADSLCDSIGDAIMEQTHAQMIERLPDTGSLRLSHPAAKEMAVLCPTIAGTGRPDLTVDYEHAPDQRFLALAAEAGELAAGGAAPPKVIADCILDATVDPSGEGRRKAGNVLIECKASGPDHGTVRISQERE
jgi:hypothetical protein